MEENKKELTLENIAKLIDASSVKTREDLTKLIVENRKILETKIDSAVEELATMTQNQFLESREYMDKRFDKVDERFEKVDKRFDEVDKKIDDLNIEVKNKNVSVFKHNDLVHRVEKLEEKTQGYDGLFPKTAKGLV